MESNNQNNPASNDSGSGDANNNNNDQSNASNDNSNQPNFNNIFSSTYNSSNSDSNDVDDIQELPQSLRRYPKQQEADSETEIVEIDTKPLRRISRFMTFINLTNAYLEQELFLFPHHSKQPA